MASEEAGAATTAEAESATFTLQIISPSVGIPQPFVIQRLPKDATIKQLKERIRNVVITRPTDEAQRLIHRGRLLRQETDTMIEIFGQEALRSGDPQSLHLVLRDLSDGRAPSTPCVPQPANQGSTFSQPPTTGPQPTPRIHPHQPFQMLSEQLRMGIPNIHNMPNHPGVAHGLPQRSVPTFGYPTVPPSMTPDQRSQWTRAFEENMGGVLNQNRQPTMLGAHGIPPTSLRGTPGTGTPGRTASPFQPDGTRTTIREGVGPNGLQWRVTYNETFTNPLQRPGRTGSPFPAADPSMLSRPVPNRGQLSDADIQSIFRNVDSGAATRAIADAMRRNASSSSLANLAANQAHHPIPPGVTTPLVASRAGSGTGTPDPLRAAGRTRSPLTGQTQTQSFQGTPEVYILSSPTGPRALLLSNGLETYYTPQVRTVYQPFGLPAGQRPLPSLYPTPYNHLNPQYMIPNQTIQVPIAQVGRAHTANTQAIHSPQPHQAAQSQHGLPQPPQHQHQNQPQPQIGHAAARPDNPQVQAIRIAQLWPPIWMIIRLGLFIWWFTSPTSGWSRWITVVSIAVTLFLVNMGFLNPFADQFWVPVRRHLENLIPLADGHQRGAQANGRAGNGDAGADARQQELDPADTAARLVQQRRDANANWLMDQVRRLERAGILFLASIAPGVAERHIAQMEADAQAERRRREEAAAAAAAAAAAEQAERQEGSADAEQNAEGGSPATSNNETEGREQAAEAQRDNEQRPAAEEPLIPI